MEAGNFPTQVSTSSLALPRVQAEVGERVGGGPSLYGNGSIVLP